jgi:hypothetical protein
MATRDHEKPLTIEQLKALISYDPSTGGFIRVVRAGPVKAGDRAESSGPFGYLLVFVARNRYYAHRLAWFYSHGAWPVGDVDHINGDRSDNRLSNLRVCDRAQNCCNRKKARSDSSVGLPNVYFRKPSGNRAGSYVAEVKHKGKRLRRYGFKTAQDAFEASKELAAVLHGEFSKHLGSYS